MANNLFMTSRRKFIAQCSAVTTVAALPAGLGVCSSLGLREVALDRLGFSTFARLVGSRFHVLQPQGTVGLELIEAEAGQGRAFRRGMEKDEPEEFSLLFCGAPDQPLGQDSYAFAHARVGRFVMFIVPVWDLVAVTGARFYEAVFNRAVGVDPSMF